MMPPVELIHLIGCGTVRPLALAGQFVASLRHHYEMGQPGTRLLRFSTGGDLGEHLRGRLEHPRARRPRVCAAEVKPGWDGAR